MDLVQIAKTAPKRDRQASDERKQRRRKLTRAAAAALGTYGGYTVGSRLGVLPARVAMVRQFAQAAKKGTNVTDAQEAKTLAGAMAGGLGGGVAGGAGGLVVTRRAQKPD